MHLAYRVGAGVTAVVLVVLLVRYYTSAGSFPQIHETLQTHKQDLIIRDKGRALKRRSGTPHLVAVACGKRSVDDAMTMLRSAVLFTKTFLTLDVFTGSATEQEHVRKELESWPADVKARLNYTILTAKYPAEKPCPDCRGLNWKSLFRPCASQRLFLADVLPDVDSVIYVDADSLFLAPIEELWSVFSKFNSTQFLGVGPDSDEPKTGYYHGKPYIPIYGENGINSGVLLMNLTRIRTSNWTGMMAQYYIKYNKRLVLGDNDLINIYLHDHPERGYKITCDWNYHGWQCIRCDQANMTGAAILHATGHSFINDKIPQFKAINKAFQQFELGTSTIESDLLPSLVRNLDEARTMKASTDYGCHKNLGVFTNRIRDFIIQR